MFSKYGLDEFSNICADPIPPQLDTGSFVPLPESLEDAAHVFTLGHLWRRLGLWSSLLRVMEPLTLAGYLLGLEALILFFLGILADFIQVVTPFGNQAHGIAVYLDNWRAKFHPALFGIPETLEVSEAVPLEIPHAL
jgi:hypothetical protein